MLPACVMHDLCYLAFNTTRSDCDDWFYRNMRQTCKLQSGFFSRLACQAAALAAYTTVVLAGGIYFEDGKEWAQVNCIAETSVEKSGSGGFGSGIGSGLGSGLASGFGSSSGSGSAYMSNSYKVSPILI